MIDYYDLKGKHILVTGASSGIGKETAILLSRFGANVSLVARREDKLKETIEAMDKGDHRYYVSDLSKTEEISALIESVVKESGPVDGLIHCAGIGVNLPVMMTKPEAVETVMRTNFYSFAELLRLFAKKKNSNNGASFVGISSVAALKGDKTQGAYAASKAAMNAFIHPAAKELASRQIRVNTVAFGMIKTEAYEKFLESGGQDDALANQYLGYGSPTDAANLLVFMVSSASRLITGTTVVCDGGYIS